MKIVLKLIGLLLGFLVAFLAYAFLLAPKHIEVKKEITIDAPVEKTFDFIRSLKKLSNETVWQKIDPNVKKTYSGIDGQVGSVYKWESNHKNVGVGEQEIVDIQENASVKCELRFKTPFESKDIAVMYTDAVKGGKTKIMWEYKSQKIPAPFNAIVHFTVTPKLKKQFDESLANIKKAIEE